MVCQLLGMIVHPIVSSAAAGGAAIPFWYISPRAATLLRGEEEEGVEWGLAGRTLGRVALLKQKMDGKELS